MQKQRLNSAIITLMASIFFLAIKYYAYHLTGSKAILSDALEGIVNVIAALTLIFVVYYASLPADKNHPYGHGKIEYIASAFEGGSILFAGILICIDSFIALQHPTPLRALNWGLGLTMVAGICNGALGFYLKSMGKKNHSVALQSSGEHLISDFWTTIGVMLGLLLVKITQVLWADPLVALVVSLHLIWTGLNILKESGSELMDAEDKGLLGKILTLFNQHNSPGIIHVHSTRIMRSGPFHHIEAHIVVPEFWEIKQAHDYVDQFEKKLLRDYPTEAELFYHLDPCRTLYCERCSIGPCPIRNQEFKSSINLTLEEIVKPDLERK